MLGTTEAAADQLEFSGKRVLVTGGTKGIGEAVVNRFRDKTGAFIAGRTSDRS
jgi:NAD(P)-dependent dehydrogenase (short-subunit alcohol dehydrogenase family)